jgi:serine/threonine protein kinase
MAPELLLHGHASKASDVYAYGILLWEMLTGGRAFKGYPVALLAYQVRGGVVCPPQLGSWSSTLVLQVAVAAGRWSCGSHQPHLHLVSLLPPASVHLLAHLYPLKTPTPTTFTHPTSPTPPVSTENAPPAPPAPTQNHHSHHHLPAAVLCHRWCARGPAPTGRCSLLCPGA